jgi:hypothetical protein
MGSWAVIFATCGMICLGIGVGGRLDARTSSLIFLLAAVFLTLAITLHVSSLLLKARRRRR